ncbi:MAG: hypothetical protein ABF876_16020, partial [Acetobacter aceti]
MGCLNGLIQLTGRYNYEDANKKYNENITKNLPTLPNTKYNNDKSCFSSLADFISNPTLLSQFPLCIEESCFYWKSRGCNKISEDTGDVSKVTLSVNGGLNGLSFRIKSTKKAKTLLSATTEKEIE